MPLFTNNSFKATVVALALGAAAFSAPAMASAAELDATTLTPATCPEQPTTKAFAAYGDTFDYSLAPGGDFETDADGWTLNNADVDRGNETAGITPGKHSLSLGGNWRSGAASAVSPAFCVDNEQPHFRYVVRSKGLVGRLTTSLRFRAADGTTAEEEVVSVAGTNLRPGAWKPSVLNPLAIRIPLALQGKAATVQLVFTTRGNLFGGGFQIDSVLVDPYRRN